MTPVVVVMGVAGSGKSTVAVALADRLGWDVVDGDALHPPRNIAKMAAGHPLDDADRVPWLQLVREWIVAQQAVDRPGIVACSALRRSYRDLLRGPEVRFVYLSVAPGVLAQRLASRVGHFMSPVMLDSQLQTLETPAADEDVLAVDGAATVPTIVDEVVGRLGLEAWHAG
jgi:carbohydrate kinase (thermoresistant glucokinase family)